MSKSIVLALSLLFAPWATIAVAAAEPVAGAAGEGAAEAVSWQDLKAGNEVSNISSLQEGARNFTNYCLGCHSMKFMRWSRMCDDLRVPKAECQANLMPPNAKPADYMVSSLRAEDAVAWFGKEPPDLSLIARSRGVDYIYRLFKTFYTDPSKPTHTNNLQLDGIAMPAVLSELEGVKTAVYKNVDKVVDGKSTAVKEFVGFSTVTPGQLTDKEYDKFLRDTVNFHDYAGEPAQVDRRSIGIWVVLFLLAFTSIAWFMKKEYWKDVH